ncbi:unnamed protein product [Urochloa humidicola]
MAFAAAVHPVPTSPPTARRVRSRLAAAAAEAVIYLFLAGMWLFFWALGAWHVGLIACGEGCPVAVAAGFAFPLLLCLGLLPLVARQVSAPVVARTSRQQQCRRLLRRVSQWQ